MQICDKAEVAGMAEMSDTHLFADGSEKCPRGRTNPRFDRERLEEKVGTPPRMIPYVTCFFVTARSSPRRNGLER